MMNELLKRKEQLLAELAEIEAMIEKENNREMHTLEEATIETSIVENKEKFEHKVIINGKEFARNSKKKYEYVIIAEHQGRVFVDGYASSEKTAQSSANGWFKIGSKAKVIKL